MISVNSTMWVFIESCTLTTYRVKGRDYLCQRPILSNPEKRMKLEPTGLYVEEGGSEVMATEDDDVEEEEVEELFGDDDEDEEEGELELEEEVDEEDDEEQDETERLAEVLGVEVFERGNGASSNADRRSITIADQQEETNRAEDRKLLALMAHFNDDQLSRFESYRRATFTKSAVSRVRFMCKFVK